MKTLPILVILSCCVTLLQASEIAAPVETKTQKGAFEVTTTLRTNGCTLELHRYTKSRPDLLGYWVQNALVGEQRVLRLEHSQAMKEQSLVIDQSANYRVIQIDRDLDGKFEMFLVLSVADQRLVDVLMFTADGWLRHGTTNEIVAREALADANKRGLKQIDKAIKDESDKLKKDLDDLVK